MKFIHLIIAAAAGLSLGACASPYGGAPASTGSTAQDTPAKPDFGNLDANDDQQLSVAEAAANISVSRGFKRADANGDGTLSREEFRSVDSAGR